MNADLQQLMHDVESLGYRLLSFRRGVFYIAGYGLRDIAWCLRVWRLQIPAKGKVTA